jgi:hypothetical protein
MASDLKTSGRPAADVMETLLGVFLRHLIYVRRIPETGVSVMFLQAR